MPSKSSSPESPAASKPKRGRPRGEYSIPKIRELAANFCTLEEIAAGSNIPIRTLQRHKDNPDVRDAIDAGKALGRARLRGIMWKLAQKGNVAAAIFLAKQVSILGYSDKTEMQHSGPDGGPMQTTTSIVVEFVDPPERPPARPPLMLSPAAPAE